jgi:hypothetical protein
MVDFSEFRPEKWLDMIIGHGRPSPSKSFANNRDSLTILFVLRCSNTYFQDTGMEIWEKTIIVEGRLLKPPSIFFMAGGNWQQVV